MSPTAEVTHVSESTLASQTAQITELRQAFEAAEVARQAAEQASTARIERLQTVLADREDSLTEQGKALEDLQTRYEKTRRAFRKLQSEKEDLAGQIDRANRRHETTTATIDQLREANRQAVTDLEAARAELANSTVPEVSQLEQLRVENRKLTTDKAALEKKAQSMSHDFEFTRQQYQQASSAAAEHWSKIQDLEQENAGLRQKASGEAVRLRELTNRSEVETHVTENTRLKAENEELKEQLKRKERGRGMTTRTGSVAPRSPRLGGSPGRSRAGSRAPGSRPQSPVRNFYGARRGRGLVEQSL
jgi:chromosome segregation ATPase